MNPFSRSLHFQLGVEGIRVGLSAGVMEEVEVYG
jgi:hypothetical protein